MFKDLIILFFFLFCGQLHSVDLPDNPLCFNSFLASNDAVIPPHTKGFLKYVNDFVEQHDLASKIVKIASGDQEQERLVVGLDYTNRNHMDLYRDHFNIDSGDDSFSGSLPLEFQSQAIADRGDQLKYVNSTVRPYGGANTMSYRFGEPKEAWGEWRSRYLDTSIPQGAAVAMVSHLIPLSEEMGDNLGVYFNPNKKGLRARVPGTRNCVAWVCQIELGRTAGNSTTAERNYLFHYLGMARSTAHFEISRRLFHAANHLHKVIFMFYMGEENRKIFDGDAIYNYFPPVPKIPFRDIIRDKDTREQIAKTKGLVLDKVEKQLGNPFDELKPGDRIFVPIGSGASADGLHHILEKSKTLDGPIHIDLLVNGVSRKLMERLATESNGNIKLRALFVGGNMRELYHKNLIDYIPGNLSDFSKQIADPKSTEFNYDYILTRTTLPNNNGILSFGTNHDHIMSILQWQSNVKIVTEMNKNMPRTYGTNKINIDRVFRSFESDSSLGGPVVVPLTDVEKTIGENIGTLIGNGSTLQIGIGNVFDGIPAALEKRDDIEWMDIRSEMFGNNLMEIMRSQNVGSAKTGFIFGSDQLYQWVDGNSNLVMESTDVVNNVGLIASTPNFVAINTTLEVNLFGETNATMSPTGRISSPGGQIEFMDGASKSIGGKSVIAVRSTAKQGEISTIVIETYFGPITTPHEMVSHVVTEYGIAHLRGKTERQRAIALINIAHPKFREKLLNQAIEKNLLTNADKMEIAK